MARLRKFTCYRHVKRPYTRKSKYRKKSFIRADPHPKIVKFNIGNANGNFSHQIDLIATKDTQIRDNALESARMSANRYLEKTLGKSAYYFRINVFPHHVLREHALAAGAGADRFSSGMAHAFGKPMGIAAQVKEDQPLVSIWVNERGLKPARKALTLANHKLPCRCQIVVR